MAVSDTIRRQMYEAVTSGAVAEMKRVVRANPAVLEECWNVSDSFLHLAAMKGQDSICAALIDGGADVNVAGGASATPLADAAAHGHLSTARLLLERGASVDGLPTSTATPLMNAAVEGYVDVARLLIDTGAEVNREHLKLPQTALDFAVFYQVKNTGQAQVADLLRSHGAIRPYTEKHDWAKVPGQMYIEHIERALGGFVNPLTVSSTDLGRRRTGAVRKARIPKKYDHQFLFTVGLNSAGPELGLCLPAAWPLNQASLQQKRFRWPVTMLEAVAAAHREGLALTHGQVVLASHPSLRAADVGKGIEGWVFVLHQVIEEEREDDDELAQTLLLVPVTTKKPVAAGTAAVALADKKASAKWDKIAIALDHAE